MSQTETRNENPTLAAIRAATTAEELAEALEAWAIKCSEEAGESPQWWVGQLRRYCEGRADEAGGMTLEELIPETIEEWRNVRAGLSDTRRRET